MHENNCQLTCWNCPVWLLDWSAIFGLITHVALSQHLLSMQDPLLKNLNTLKIRLIDLPVSSKYYDLVSWVSWNFRLQYCPTLRSITTPSRIALLTKARRPDGVLKACRSPPIYCLPWWPVSMRGYVMGVVVSIIPPHNYLVEMCLSCNFFQI